MVKKRDGAGIGFNEAAAEALREVEVTDSPSSAVTEEHVESQSVEGDQSATVDE